MNTSQFSGQAPQSENDKRFAEVQGHGIPFIVSEDDPELQIIRAALADWRARGRPSRH